VFVYISEVDQAGRSWYITEGSLRLLHRAEAKPPASYNANWVYRNFHREQAKHMQPGVFADVRFSLLPISWTLQPGSRLRVSIAGTDAEHFAQVPHGRPPLLNFALGGESGCFIDIPYRSE
jgi:predicted acyl esterase